MSQLTICLIIFVLMVIGFCIELYSLATVSLLSMVALVLTGCMEAKEALSFFANNNVIMIAGMCVVAAGFNRTKFCSNLADGISSMAKGSLNKMMFGYVLIGMLLSQFIQSPMIAMGIVLPMLMASAEKMNVNASKVVFPLGVVTVVTCCTLPIGAGATVAAELNGYLESYGYVKHVVGFLDPVLARFPLLIITVLYCSFFATKLSPEKPIIEKNVSNSQKKNVEPLKPFQEYAGIFIFFADAAALMFSKSIGLDNWMVTMLGALAMVVFGILKPKEATASLPLSMLLLVVGALAMSSALSSTGTGELIGSHIAGLVNLMGGNSYAVGFIFFIIPFFMTQVMQNRGTMLIFHPIAIATCASIGANPVGLMLIVQSACLSSFMTPMATAAIPYMMECGGYDQRSMFKQSWMLVIICCVVSVGWIMTMFPL